MRFRKLIFGTDIGWGSRRDASCCDLDLTFELAVVPSTFEILFSLFLGNCKVQ